MKLKDGNVCLNCDEVFVLNRSNGFKCPGCGGNSFWSLERWMGRIKDTEVKVGEKRMISEGIKKGL